MEKHSYGFFPPISKVKIRTKKSQDFFLDFFLFVQVSRFFFLIYVTLISMGVPDTGLSVGITGLGGRTSRWLGSHCRDLAWRARATSHGGRSSEIKSHAGLPRTLRRDPAEVFPRPSGGSANGGLAKPRQRIRMVTGSPFRGVRMVVRGSHDGLVDASARSCRYLTEVSLGS